MNLHLFQNNVLSLYTRQSDIVTRKSFISSVNAMLAEWPKNLMTVEKVGAILGNLILKNYLYKVVYSKHTFYEFYL